MPGRKEDRFETDLTVSLEGGGEGVARNVSANGIYFVTDAALEHGQQVNFSLQFEDFPSGPIAVHCTARVVRVVEERGTSKGVGAAISSFEFRSLSSAGRSSH